VPLFSPAEQHQHRSPCRPAITMKFRFVSRF